MLDDVTEWKSDRISQKVAGRRLYGMIYEIPLIVNTGHSAIRELRRISRAPVVNSNSAAILV